MAFACDARLYANATPRRENAIESERATPSDQQSRSRVPPARRLKAPIILYEAPKRRRTDYRVGLAAWTDKSMLEEGEFYPRKTMTRAGAPLVVFALHGLRLKEMLLEDWRPPDRAALLEELEARRATTKTARKLRRRATKRAA